MKILKKIWILLLWFIMIFCINFNYWNISSPWFNIEHNQYNIKPIIWNNDINENPISQWSNIFSNKLSGIIHIPQTDEYNTSLWYIMALVQITINWLLWILSFVALVYMLYCWFLIFSSWSDDKKSGKWKKWITTAAIAIAGIGLSWLIISIIIRFINNIATA